MENNNPQEFNFEKYNDFLSKIKSGSPVHKINFTLESPNAIVGMYLMTMEDVQSYLDKAADYTDLNNDTLLVFESRHVIECCQIIYGCLKILTKIKMLKVSIRFIIENITKALLTRPLFYSTVISEMDYIATSSINMPESDNSIEVLKGFKYIMKNIWFVPYGKIDEMAKEGIDEFKKACENNEKNE